MKASVPWTASVSIVGFLLVAAFCGSIAGKSSSAELPPAPGACSSDEAVASTVAGFASALAIPGSEKLRPYLEGTFLWWSTGAPTSLVPRLNGDPRYRSVTRTYGGYAAYSPRKLLRFKRRIESLPLEIGAVAIARRGAMAEGERYADFAYSGTILGNAKWRRALGFRGKGAINCDGTIRAWSMVIVGPPTPYRRTANVCNRRPPTTRTQAVKVCRQ